MNQKDKIDEIIKKRVGDLKMIMIPQTKGGVGKSTVAMQVIAPYLHNKHKKKIRYIEIDDENKDSNTFFNTKIVDKEIFQTHKFTNLDELILMDDYHHHCN